MQADDGGGLQAGWDSSLGQRLVACEDSIQLACTVLQYTSSDAIGSSCLPWVHSLQCASHLMLYEGEAAVDRGMWYGCLGWFHLEGGKENVQFLCQRGITISNSKVDL